MRAPRLPEEVLAYYELGLEQGRLDVDYFPLERERTRELVLRHLGPGPKRVVDVGGGAGAYALWLARLGHAVQLLDPVPLHVEQARQASAAASPAAQLAGARVGDARALPYADASADAVLLLGPLYHLTERDDRLKALAEACRVLRPGGLVFAAAISRFVSLLDGLRGAAFDDAAFLAITERDLLDGQHRNPTAEPRYFTTAFFHHPEELAGEVRAAGLALEGLYAVEGPGALMPDFARRWADAEDRALLLRLVRRVESEPSLLGQSPHLLAVGRRG